MGELHQPERAIIVLGMPITGVVHAWLVLGNVGFCVGDGGALCQPSFALNMSGLGVASAGVVLGIVLAVRGRPPGRMARVSLIALIFVTVALLIASFWSV